MSQHREEEPEEWQGVLVVGKDHEAKAQALASISQDVSGARASGEDDTRKTWNTSWTNHCDCATMEFC